MNMRSKVLTAVAALATMMLASCEYNVSVRTKDFRDSEKWGKVVRQDLKLDEFSAIESWAGVDIEFFQSDTFRVQVEGNEKAIKSYKFEVVNDTTDGESSARLVATWNKDLYSNDVPAIRLHVYAPTIDAIDIEGSGDIDLRDSIDADQLNIVINGDGDVDVRTLKCGEFNIAINGTGDVSVRKVTSNELKADIEGSGDVYVRKAFVEGGARLEVNGSGDIEGMVRAKTIYASSVGSGDIDLEVYCDEITVISEGSGDVEIEGETKTLKKSKQALGTTTTKKLRAESMEYIK